MIKIDDKKIIVSSFDELKEVLEEYNTYNYIFLWMILVLQKIYLLDLMFNYITFIFCSITIRIIYANVKNMIKVVLIII